MSSPGTNAAIRSPAARACSAAAICLTALVVIWRPIGSGMLYGLTESVVVALLLLAAGLMWLCGQALAGRVTVQGGAAAVAFGAFMLAALASALRAEDAFAGLRWWLFAATCGLTALLVLQTAESERLRRFFLSCLVAGGVAAAAYAVWHLAFYEPALRAWLKQSPELFEAVSGSDASSIGDLSGRVASSRATGSFITPNQLADFLALAAIPLAGVVLGLFGRRGGAEPAPPRPVAHRAVLAGALALVLVALGLTRSKGGWIGFGCGLAVFAAGLLLTGPERRKRRALYALVPLAVMLCVGVFLAISLGSASLGARLGYWKTTVSIAMQRPLLGVGPGSWGDWYARLKAPEFEETRAAHSAYMELWAETGAVGVGLFLLAWALLLRRSVRALARPTQDAAAPCPMSEAGLLTEPGLMVAGLVLAALAFAFDFLHVGTFYPPGQGVPAWLLRAPQAPYLLIYAVWAATFVAAFRSGVGASARLIGWGLAGGLAAFLVHSAGEFTLIVPALAGSAGVAAALFLAGAEAPRREVTSKAGRALAVAVAAAALALFAGPVAPRVFVWSQSLKAAEGARMRALVPALGGQASAGARSAAGEDVTALYRRACTAMPWDDDAWRALAAWLMQVGQPADAAQAMEHAVALAPLHSGHWAMLGAARLAAGDAAAAAPAYRRAAELYPALPAAWYRYGTVLTEAWAPEDQQTAAYRRALELLPRQFSARNRVLGPVLELVRFYAELEDRPVRQVLLDMWQRRWAAMNAKTAWSDVPDEQKLAFALNGSGVRPVEAAQAQGWEIPVLWDAAGAQAHVELLIDIGQSLGAYEGSAHTAPGGTDKERLAALADGLTGGPELLHDWDAIDWSHRQARLWSVAAERLWLWALREKVRRGAGGETGLALEPGAGGGT